MGPRRSLTTFAGFRLPALTAPTATQRQRFPGIRSESGARPRRLRSQLGLESLNRLLVSGFASRRALETPWHGVQPLRPADRATCRGGVGRPPPLFVDSRLPRNSVGHGRSSGSMPHTSTPTTAGRSLGGAVPNSYEKRPALWIRPRMRIWLLGSTATQPIQFANVPAIPLVKRPEVTLFTCTSTNGQYK